MYLQYAPIYYVKYKNEESEVKAQMKLIKEEGVAEITVTRKRKVNMRRSVTLEHCFGGEETKETTRRRKSSSWIFCIFKEKKEIS